MLRRSRWGLVVSFLWLGCGEPALPGGGAPQAAEEISDSAPVVELPAVSSAAPLEDAAAFPDCHYTEADFHIAWCNHRWRNIWDTVPTPATPGCPGHRFRVGTHWYATFDDALGAEQCETACLYRPAAAVMFVRCGHRDEFTEFSAGTECPPLYGFSDGTLGTSVDDWLKANPCP